MNVMYITYHNGCGKNMFLYFFCIFILYILDLHNVTILCSNMLFFIFHCLIIIHKIKRRTDLVQFAIYIFATPTFKNLRWNLNFDITVIQNAFP